MGGTGAPCFEEAPEFFAHVPGASAKLVHPRHPKVGSEMMFDPNGGSVVLATACF